MVVYKYDQVVQSKSRGNQLVYQQNKASVSNKSVGCHRDQSRQQTASDCEKAGKGKSTSNFSGKEINTKASKPFSQRCGGAGQEKASTMQLSGQKHGNTDVEPTQQKAEKKQKISPLCPASSMRALLEKEGLSIEDEEDDGDNGYEVNADEVNGKVNKDDLGAYFEDEHGSQFRGHEVAQDNGEDHIHEQNEDGERDKRNEEDENQIGHDDEELQNAAASGEGPSTKKGRGITVCGKVHGRSLDQRPVIELDGNGDLKGPPAAVYELSSFLGTMARNARWCPLNYTSWKAIPEKETTIWDYVKAKYDIPDEGRTVCLRIMNDAWRKWKHYLRAHVYSCYQTKKDRLKHLPASVPVPHFLELCAYWNRQKTITICTKNAGNIKGYKWRHRKGKQRFSVVREKLRAAKENHEEPTQVEMFIETRTVEGKANSVVTQETVGKLKSYTDDGKTPEEAFVEVFGKEHPGRVRCGGRMLTVSMKKKNEEIRALEEKHAAEVAAFREKQQEMEEKQRQLEEKQRKSEEMQFRMEERQRQWQLQMKELLAAQNPSLNLQCLDELMQPLTPHSANSVHRSSVAEVSPVACQAEADADQDGQECGAASGEKR